MSAIVTFTPATSGTTYFAVVAVGSTTGESGLSGELPIGTPDLCREDSCTSKTSCTFVNRDDGSSCDDGIFCNGPEVCVNGACDSSASRNCADAVACTVDACDEANARCTHSGPPGCCSACDTRDPCLVAACAEGDCSAESGIEITANRWRFLAKASGVKLAARGSFILDSPLDPSNTGIVVELQAPDGAVLYSSSLRAASVKVGASGGRYRVVIPRSQSDFETNGPTVFDLRVKDNVWSVVMKSESPQLMDAFLEPTLTWVLRFGATCARRMDLSCIQTPKISTCAEPNPPRSAKKK